jgi:VCBS repeat-containing protein
VAGTLVAGDDDATLVLASGSRVVIAIRNNDRDSANHRFEVISTSPASHGNVEILGNGALRYTLTSTAGSDSFTYTIQSEDGDTATATVTVAIVG